jgi:hypothetical protein
MADDRGETGAFTDWEIQSETPIIALSLKTGYLYYVQELLRQYLGAIEIFETIHEMLYAHINRLKHCLH